MSTNGNNNVSHFLITVAIVLGMIALAPTSAGEFGKLKDSRNDSAEAAALTDRAPSTRLTRQHVLSAQLKPDANGVDSFPNATMQGVERPTSGARPPATQFPNKNIKAKDPKRNRICTTTNQPGGGMKVNCTNCINHGGPHESCVDTVCTIPAPGPQGLSNPPGTCLTGEPYKPH